LSKEIRGKIELVYPEINPDNRINLVRVAIPNQGGLLKPGMPVYVELKNRQSHGASLPSGAVIRNEEGDMVWLQVGHNTYKSIVVQTGTEDGDLIEIRSGLEPGDVVVTDGAYLLNSEYIFRNGSEPARKTKKNEM
jgi:Cu(I)/Ag(I) efflux system membrane fusion protein